MVMFFLSPSGFEFKIFQATRVPREEIEAFRDKSQFGDNENNGDGCYSGRKNCAERPGAPHSWMYVDDLSSSIASDWELPVHLSM
ncbi:MAG: hypothetical protein Ct9H90mP23_1700 [Methanobacteriota archaeon]|nr:MAG: hypothetical protein Ct9H90mP23_1700 [Euryarchaeota archaeon]